MRTKLIAIDASGNRQACIAQYSESEPWKVEIELVDGRRESASGSDLFEALREVRSELDSSGIRLCCNGARRDAWPSPLSSQSGALFLYAVPMRRKPGLRDIVPTFGECSPDKTASVAQQDAYKEMVDRSGLQYLSAVNPVAWWRALVGALKGPKRWIPVEDPEGLVSWVQTR